MRICVYVAFTIVYTLKWRIVYFSQASAVRLPAAPCNASCTVVLMLSLRSAVLLPLRSYMTPSIWMALLIVTPTVRIVRSGVYAHVNTACRIQILLRRVEPSHHRLGKRATWRPTAPSPAPTGGASHSNFWLDVKSVATRGTSRRPAKVANGVWRLPDLEETEMAPTEVLLSRRPKFERQQPGHLHR